MEISIIIPTYNRKDKLEKCLQHIDNLDYDKSDLEVIVVNDVSGDGTKRFLEKESKNKNYLKPINRENKSGIGSARNRALKEAKGKYIFFTDDDCLVPEDWIHQHHKRRKKHNVEVVNGVQYPVKMNWVEAYKTASHFQHYQDTRILKKPNTVDAIKTNNLSLKKEIIEEVGDFNENLERAEDTEIGRRILKAGYKAVTDPTLRVKHLKNDKLKEHIITQYKLGKSLKKVEQIHGKTTNDRITDYYILKAWKKYSEKTPIYLSILFPLIALTSTIARRIGQLK